MLPILPDRESSVAWTVHISGETKIVPGKPYWYDNNGREPRGRAVVELVTHGVLAFREGGAVRLIEKDQIVIFFYGDANGYGQVNGAASRGHRSRWLIPVGAGVGEHLRALVQGHGLVFDAKPGSPLRLAVDVAYDLSQERGIGMRWNSQRRCTG